MLCFCYEKKLHRSRKLGVNNKSERTYYIIYTFKKGEDGVEVRVVELVGRSDYRQPACERGLPWCPVWAPWSHSDFTNDIVLMRLGGPPLPTTTTTKIAPIIVGTRLLPPGNAEETFPRFSEPLPTIKYDNYFHQT